MSGQLFILGLADIFSIYPEIFKTLINNEKQKQQQQQQQSTKIQKSVIDFQLPSDFEWQEKVYYRLLEIQKRINYSIESGLEPEEFFKKNDKPKWDPTMQTILDNIKRPSSTSSFDISDITFTTTTSSTSASTTVEEIQKKRQKRRRRRCIRDHPIEYIDVKVLGTWSLENISKAAKLLNKPPMPVTFKDEHEMRRVYSLIYDVFRYKNVLNQTLNDVSFYCRYPQLKNDENRVWLMLFELYIRHFLKRRAEEKIKQDQLYKDAEVDYIAECLWTNRIHLAAAITRLRIENSALLLSQLLPTHLQDDKVAIAAANPIVTGWMNPFKLKDKSLAIEALKDMGLTEVHENNDGDNDDENEKPLKPNQYKWDKVCPLFISCLPNDRSSFAQSDLVRNYYFVIQDRTFSVAPAVLSRLLDHFELDGDIIQTHVESPRSTAYLAALFYSVNRVHDFLAFGAGQMLNTYEDYNKMLGVNNIRLYAENFCSLPLDTPILNTVVGIFATPPNSFSGISDPIELICSRGGDLNMLAVLTESEISENGKKRVAQLLQEQHNTLKLAMSRPQVQFVLYETHSIVDSENQRMVDSSVEDINRCAFEKHLQTYKEKKRSQQQEIEQTSSSGIIIENRSLTTVGASVKKPSSSSKLKSIGNSQELQEIQDESTEPDYSKLIEIPKTDEFLVSNIPDICINQDKCLNFDTMGCFVSLIHRKEITKLDAKYLIKMAEERGLFGKGNSLYSNMAEKRKLMKTKQIKRQEKQRIGRRRSSQCGGGKLKKDDILNLINRLTQPTHASLIRSNLKSFSSSIKNGKTLNFNYERKACLRHIKHNQYSPTNDYYLNGHFRVPRAKIWRKNTVNYVNNLNKQEKEIIQKNNQKKENEISNDDCIQGKIIKISQRENLMTNYNKSSLSPLRLPRTCSDLQNNHNNGNIDNTNDQLPPQEPQEQQLQQTQSLPLKLMKLKSPPSFFEYMLEKRPFPVTINHLKFNKDYKVVTSSRQHINFSKLEKFHEYPMIVTASRICDVCRRPREINFDIHNNNSLTVIKKF